MKGITRTAWLMLCWGRAPHWLLVIGLLLTLAGLVCRFVPMTLIGMIAAVISSVLVSGVVFRSICASRAMQLIPHGRLQLLFGAIANQLLIAVFIAAVTAIMAATGPNPHPSAVTGPGGVFVPMLVTAFALLTLQFIGYFVTSPLRVGFFWLLSWIVWPQLIEWGLRSWHLQALLASMAGQACVAGVTLLAWLAFAVGYLRSRQIRPPHWTTLASRAPQPAEAQAAPVPHRSFTRAAAIGTLLSGVPGARGRTLMLRVLIPGLCVPVVLAIVNGLRGHWNFGNLFVVLVCLAAGPFTGSLAGVMSPRARPLWLHPGFGRLALFAQIEARCWRVLLVVCALCCILAIAWLAFSVDSPPSPARNVCLLVTPLVSGALFIYAQLQFVRGWRVLDQLVLAGAIVLWMAEAGTVVAGAAQSSVTAILGAQVILVPLLRTLALRRWQRLDWLLFRRSVLQSALGG